jgi:hypothetical protein
MQEEVLIIVFFVPTFRAVDFLSCSWLQILVILTFTLLGLPPLHMFMMYFFPQRKSHVQSQEVRWHDSHESILL